MYFGAYVYAFLLYVQPSVELLNPRVFFSYTSCQETVFQSGFYQFTLSQQRARVPVTLNPCQQF